MKWTITALLTIWMITGSILIAEDINPSDTICRAPTNPFYELTATTSGNVTSETLNVTITSPNETVYYENTISLNATVLGGDGTYICQYKINDNAWNTIDCPGGIIQETVTYPEGAVTVYVHADDEVGEVGNDNFTFTVVLYSASLVGDFDTILFVPVLVALGFLFLDDEERPRRKKV